jgi:hypothetical protein
MCGVLQRNSQKKKPFVCRYFSRYVFTKELIHLLLGARENGQHAHLMTVLGAGTGMPIASEDLGLAEARRRSIKFLQGATVVECIYYTDFGPFTYHISPVYCSGERHSPWRLL